MATSIETRSPQRCGLSGGQRQCPDASLRREKAKGRSEEIATTTGLFDLPSSTLPFRQSKTVNSGASTLRASKLLSMDVSERWPKRARSSDQDDDQEGDDRETKTARGPIEREDTQKICKPLQDDIELLATIYDALLIAQSLLLSRKTLCTFDRLRQPAENHCSRKIKLSHLQQIKHVFPTAVEWSWVRSEPGQPESEANIRGRALKVALGPATAAEAVTDDQGIMKRHRPAMQSKAMQMSVEELRRRLRDTATEHCSTSGNMALVQEQAVSDEASELPISMAPLPADPLAPSSKKRKSMHSTPERSILARVSSVSEEFVDATAALAAEDDPSGFDGDGDSRKVRRVSHGRRVSFGPVEQRLIPPRGSVSPAAFLTPAISAGLRLNDEVPLEADGPGQQFMHPLEPISDEEDDDFLLADSSSSSSSDDDDEVHDLETLACVGLMCASGAAVDQLSDLVGIGVNQAQKIEDVELDEKEHLPGEKDNRLFSADCVEAELPLAIPDVVEEAAPVCVIVPEAIRTESILSEELPELSFEALEQLGAWEAEDEAHDDEAEARARADAKARAALPRTFDFLQGIFGASGPCGMPLATVLDRLCSSASARHTIVARSEAEDMIKALADTVPQYITLASAVCGVQGAKTVRISRMHATAELRNELKAIAENVRA